jgi:hypothetical protein
LAARRHFAIDADTPQGEQALRASTRAASQSRIALATVAAMVPMFAPPGAVADEAARRTALFAPNSREPIMRAFGADLMPATVMAATIGSLIVGPSAHVAAQGQAPPTHSAAVPCDAFRKNPDGSWTATRPVTVMIGSSSVTVNASTYRRNAIVVNGVDFVAFLDARCAPE